MAGLYCFIFMQIRFSISSISDRYIDDGFMTTNLSFDQIKAKLDTADHKDRNIRIKYQIQSCVEFLDVVIQNDNGQLTTSVFHKPTAEPYILPYTSDHPRHVTLESVPMCTTSLSSAFESICLCCWTIIHLRSSPSMLVGSSNNTMLNRC